MPDRPDIPEEAVEAVTSAIAKENFWDANAPEVRRGLDHLARAYVVAAAPALRNQGAEEERERIKKALDVKLSKELAILPGLRRAVCSALAPSEPSEHHPECPSHKTRWCDCKGLPREAAAPSEPREEKT